ncbi:hypothetical protein RhiirA1_462821 [Rhizophagus irregularis]|uniref:Uncharacterized protein n=1 Tax=Rhizophagus irregularis TaxID=588596 RepID=A0A2N0RLF3_9GLOM|nr:hypothetical protein RhiirA1_462821 [Rhizophagus irregularis]
MNSQGQFSDSESNQNPLISTAFNPQDTPVSFHERQESSIPPSETNMTQPPDSQPQPTVTNAYEISNDIVAYLLNKSLKERNAQSNEVNNCLSKNFLEIEFQQNMEQEHLVLTFDQREYLECHLKKYLSQYLLG